MEIEQIISVNADSISGAPVFAHPHSGNGPGSLVDY